MRAAYEDIVNPSIAGGLSEEASMDGSDYSPASPYKKGKTNMKRIIGEG